MSNKVACDRCDDLFEYEDLERHDDHNLYCDSCFYETKEDRIWEEADRANAERDDR